MSSLIPLRDLLPLEETGEGGQFAFSRPSRWEKVADRPDEGAFLKSQSNDS